MNNWKLKAIHLCQGVSIDGDTFHGLATANGYTKAAPPAKPESEAEWLVRLANAAPPEARPDGKTAKVEFSGAAISIGRHSYATCDYRLMLSGAFAAYIAVEKAAYIYRAASGWMYWTSDGVHYHNIPDSDRATIDAQAACCKAIHERTTQ